MATYTKHFGTRETPQTEAIPGKAMVANSEGGYVFAVDDWTRLDRFLILGSEGGSFYVGEKTLTKENAQAVLRCIQADGIRVVNRIVEISDAGRAPKNDPAIFALAMCAGLGDSATKAAALEALPKVCRIGTHLFAFVESVRAFRGMGRGLRRAIANWYLEKDVGALAYQLVKYRQRNGWTHRDLLRLSHPKAEGNILLNSTLAWGAGKSPELQWSDMPDVIQAFEAVNKPDASMKTVVDNIHLSNLPREAVPTEMLTRPEIWDALLAHMPMTAMIRNLGNMSRCGLLKPLSIAADFITGRLADQAELKRARIHPISVLLALKTYAQGCGFRGSGEWEVVPQVVDALDAAFYKCFEYVEPTNKRWFIGVDVSGSMGCPINNSPITSVEVAGALALTIAKTEPKYYVHGFSGEFRDLGISPRMRLDSVVKRMQEKNFGSTDCSLPMLHALERKIEADVFVVITDSETYAGRMHPCQALRQYREKMGIPAKLIVLATASNGFSIADPNDSGMIDIAGFDAAVPAIMADFAR